MHKRNEKLSIKIAVLVCVTTFESYGCSAENFLWLPC